MSKKDLDGQVFGPLTVLSFARTADNGKRHWNCQCECGSIRQVREDNIRRGYRCMECIFEESAINKLRTQGIIICSKCGEKEKVKPHLLRGKITRNETKCQSCIYSYRVEKHKRDMAENPIYAEKHRVRQMINSFLDGDSERICEASEYLGLGNKEFKDYIAKMFTGKMAWRKKGMWHLDHIHPLAEAKTKEEIKKAWYYTNLQPLTPKENMAKGSKLDWSQKDVDKN